jgi:hypothetical protein
MTQFFKARKYKKYIHVAGFLYFSSSSITTHKSQLTNHNSQITTHKSQLTNHNSQITTHYPPLTTHKKGSKSGGISITFFHVSDKNLPKPIGKTAQKTAFSEHKATKSQLQRTITQLTFNRLQKKLKKVPACVTPYRKNTIFATAKTTRRSLKLMPI